MSSEVTTAYAPLLRRIHWATAVLFITAMLIGLYCGLQLPGRLAYVVYAVVALHIAATVWHAFVVRDGTLGRMWPRQGNGEH